MDFTVTQDFVEVLDLDSDITLRPYKPSDGIQMLSYLPAEYSDSPDVEEWCEEGNEEGKAFTICRGVEIIACVGIKTVIEGVGLAWALYPPNIGDYHIDPRIVRDRLNEMMVKHNYRRVQCTVRADFPAGESYLRWLGFKCETPDGMKKYEPDGTDSILFAIVR